MPVSLTPVSALVAIVPLLLSMIYYLRTDSAEYADFKAQTSTALRQAFYRSWTIRSFFVYAVVAIALLGLFGRLDALVHLPVEFVQIAAQASNMVAAENEVFNPSFIGVLVFVFIASAVFSPILIAYLSRGKAEPVMAGDVLTLLPRNKAERRWAFAISVNAGLSEELYFRLLLPLLLTYVFGNAVAAFAVSAVLFGIIHWYQGWAGVLATTVLGVLLTFVYVGTGNLWLVVVIHAGLDLNGLLLQPFLRTLVK